MSHHLLTVDSLNRESVDHLLRVAARMEPIAQRRQVTRVLEGAVLGNLFFEASTRTRVSSMLPFAAWEAVCAIPRALPSLPWRRVSRYTIPAA